MKRLSILAILFAALLSFGLIRAEAQTYVFGTASYTAPTLSTPSEGQANRPTFTGDLNGDGIPDLAILGLTSKDQIAYAISVYLGKPDGTFAPHVDYPLPADWTIPPGFSVGDFNGDGKPDLLAVTGSLGASACIFLGNGDGTFQTSVPLSLDLPSGLSSYGAIASADLNGDGKLDLVIVGNDPTLVLLGNGDTTFQPATPYPGISGPYLAIGDFNGDGKPDLAITGNSTYGQPSVVSVLTNQGDGTFQNPVNYTVAGYPVTVAAADMNGDGKLDLVVPVHITQNSGTVVLGGVSVLLGIGDGTFASAQTYTSYLLPSSPTSLALADFNADDKTDVALINDAGPNASVTILLGNGDGTFQASPIICNGGLQPKSLVAVDANGDGKPDLVAAGGAADYYASGAIAVVLNRGDGTFADQSTFPVAQYSHSAVVGDINGDGKPDIVTTASVSNGSGQAAGGALSTLLGNGDGTFQNHIDTSLDSWPWVVAEGDFNNDGKLDLVASGTPLFNGLLSTYVGNGDGTFQTNIEDVLPDQVGYLASGDFNNDGKLDVAATMSTSPNSPSPFLFLGNGDGTFNSPVSLAAPPVGNLIAADFNGDGNLDLACATGQGISILLGKGNGTFQPYVSSLPGQYLLTIGDFNSDGKIDLAVSNLSGLVSIALGNGDGTFQLASGFQLVAILDAESPIVGDFNGDGKVDLAFTSQSANVVTILFGNGDGTFSRYVEYSTAQVPSLVAADFNRDGASDLAMLDVTNQDVAVFLNSPVAAFAPRRLMFGGQAVGTSSSESTLTLTNPGSAPLAISSIAASGDFSETNSCGPMLAIGASCQVNVTFEPTGAGERAGALTFTDSASVVPQIIPLAGAGEAPSAGLSPSSLTFPGQNTGTTSAAQTVALTNTGETALAIASIATSGDSGAEFPQTNNCPSALAPGAKCSIRVTFAPTAYNQHGGNLIVTDNAADSPQMVPLLGTGLGPFLGFSAVSLTFPGQLVGSTSAAQSIALTNSGNAALKVTSITASGDFAQTNNCGASLAVSATCTINVTFSPTAGGNRSGSIALADNAGNSPQTVSLTGTGQDFTLGMASGSSATATVAPGQTATYTLSLGGLGGLTQAVSFTCTGAPSEATCAVNPSQLTPSASGTVSTTVSVTTTAPSGAAPLKRRVSPPGPGVVLSVTAILLGTLLILASSALGLPARNPRKAWLRWILISSALASLALALVACGGGGGGSPQNPGTSAGNYTLKVTGSVSGLKHTTTVTLTVN